MSIDTSEEGKSKKVKRRNRSETRFIDYDYDRDRRRESRKRISEEGSNVQYVAKLDPPPRWKDATSYRSIARDS